jgi:2Fe-2S ferredoxin
MSMKVTFVQRDGAEKTIEGVEGESLMELARDNGVDGILGDCGGSCSCATCHVYVDAAWQARAGTPDEVETMALEMVYDVVRPNSRLCCQIKMRDELDGIRVEVAPGE